ncbi:unnamed protein product [Lactuca virosa]|uniref:DUF659 domain-containing protein n=1 Tax=Lactuca virosa TaxID=75947 RepID=A0AAU9NUX1_9ASTR|nr:unnamed protein product [Lactuca virosa]
MTSNASTTPSVGSTPTTTGAHKRNSDDVGWEYGFIPDKSNMEILQWKLKKIAKQVHNEGLRVEARQEFHEAENSLGSKAPNVIGPMDNYANIINPKEGLKEGKGKNIDLNNIVRKERILTVHKFISRWAYESVIPFHSFERDSFKMMLEVIGQFGTGLPCPTRYALSDPLLKHEVERTKKLLKNEKEWKEDGCSIMTDAWSDRKRRSIMNLCVNSKMGTVFLSSKKCFGEAHTSQHIYEYVESCIQQVGPENVVQVVTDNATNNMGAAKLLKEKIPSIFWTSCATHTINLMLEGIGALPRCKKNPRSRKKTNHIHLRSPQNLGDDEKLHQQKRNYPTGSHEICFRLSHITKFVRKKKEQLRHMFSSNEWEECKFSGKPKAIASYKMVTSVQFWSGMTQCLKVFSPLVKVLRMVDADWKPSMGFVYGEIKIAKEEIIKSLGGNEKHYKPIIDIINTKMKGWIDSTLHLTSYLLNSYYHYNDSQLQYDPDVMDAVLEFFDTLFYGDLEKQRQVVTVDLPKYKKKVDRFGCDLAIKHCKVNDADFDPASWWGLFGGATPHLTKVAMRILSLTSSSSGCEKNWSTFEGVHTKKRNRLETSKLNDLVYVQFNANLMEKKTKKRKDRNMEVLLANNSLSAQEWILDCDECDVDEVDPKTVDEALATDVSQAPRESPRTRELLDEDFESKSESEEQVWEEEEYKSDGVQIMEVCGEE